MLWADLIGPNFIVGILLQSLLQYFSVNNNVRSLLSASRQLTFLAVTCGLFTTHSDDVARDIDVARADKLFFPRAYYSRKLPTEELSGARLTAEVAGIVYYDNTYITYHLLLL